MLNGAQKFTSLDFVNLPEKWFPILSLHLQKLEKLSLAGTPDDWDFSHPYEFILPYSSLSNILSLCQIFLVHCSLNWALPNRPCVNITDKFHLVHMLDSTCIRLLMLCPNLIEYHCEYPHPDPIFKDLPLDTTVFHNMRLIHIPDSAVAPFGGLLSQLYFPVLETFSLELCNMVVPQRVAAPQREKLLSFIRRLPVTCSALKITKSYGNEVITRIIRAVPPHVQSLSIPDMDLKLTLRALCDNTDSMAATFQMPGLRHMHVTLWNHCGFMGDEKELNAQLFLDMVSARKELLGGHFVLEIDYGAHGNTCWTVHLQDRLRALISDGFRLEIFASGVLIPCLQEIYEELGS